MEVNNEIQTESEHMIAITTRNQKKQQEEAAEIENETTPLPETEIKEKQSKEIENENIILEEEINDQAEELKKLKDQKLILKEYHDSKFGGHTGWHRTYDRIRKKFKWKGMQKDIIKYVKRCLKCQQNKAARNTKMPMELVKVASEPFEKIYLDIVGPLEESNQGNKYILTIMDDLTRFMDCYALQTIETEQVARILVEEIICRYRIPKIIVTDQGTNFTSDLFKRICKMLNIEKLQTTAYHPQSNGALERAHRPLAEYLRMYAEEEPKIWDTLLRFAMFVHNNSPNASTKLTPMICLFGFPADIPSNLKRKPEPVYNAEDYYMQIRYKLQRAHQIARKNMIKSKIRAKKYYDKTINPVKFKIGDKVMLKNPIIKNKFSKIWTGPYEVVEINSPVNVTIKEGRKRKRINNNRLKKYEEPP
jgi:Integrase zinc binding domain/Integrase core domain